MDANQRQVGGSHYANKYQHWDFVIKYDLNYFEAQITKYVTRHSNKNGLQDLEKAKHFAEKYLENFLAIPHHPKPHHPLSDFFRYNAENRLSAKEARVMYLLSRCPSGELETKAVIRLIEELIEDWKRKAASIQPIPSK